MIETTLASINRLLMGDGFIKTYYDIGRRRSPAVTSPMTSSLLEVMIVNHGFSDKLVPLAAEILSNWTKVSFFQKYGLFPSKYYISMPTLNSVFLRERIPVTPKIKNFCEVNFFTHGSWIDVLYRLPWGVKVQVSKDNTNMIFALIEAYRLLRHGHYKMAITYWIDNIREKLFNNGLLYRFWRPAGKLNNVELTSSFAVIDVLCDVYCYVDRNHGYLDWAEEIAGAWINSSIWSTGLLPRRFNGDVDHLDDQTDFTISLLRLFELTEKKAYQNMAERMTESILRYHHTNDGYVTSVDKNGNKCSGIEPKYNALLLKLLILLSENRKIYGDDSVHQLVKDR
jgi:hypothetical protein